MSRNLQGFIAVDQGNTRIKLTEIRNCSVEDIRVFASEDFESVAKVCAEKNEIPVAFCSTRLEDSLVEDVGSRYGWFAVTHSTPLPIEIRYENPLRLGIDRIVSACGANEIFGVKSVAIADFGTALTFDVIRSGIVFEGGNISPGIRLRLESLHEATALLPRVEPEGETPVFGYSTETAIRSGVVRGIAYETIASFRESMERYGCELLILTGGDAELMDKEMNKIALKDESMGRRIVKESGLLAFGLKAIYEYNDEKN